jgi:hypothetical protein
MGRIAARSILTVPLAVLALVLAASSGTATASNQGPFLGVVPHAGLRAPTHTAVIAAAPSGPVVYHGGQVMHTNTVYTIFWVPTGFSVDANYESLINQ